MLTDPKLRSQVDALWETPSRRFWSGDARFQHETFGTF